nr:MAG TPA: hypothetical protein [Caudoviricetes sp.]
MALISVKKVSIKSEYFLMKILTHQSNVLKNLRKINTRSEYGRF